MMNSPTVSSLNRLKRVVASVLLVLISSILLSPPALAGCCRCSKSDPEKTICLSTEIACNDVISQLKSKNPKLDGISCSGNLNESQCRTVANGGICSEQAEAALYEPSGGGTAGEGVPNPNETFVVKAPVPGIAVPGLKFSENLKPVDGYLSIPFIGQYISSIYSFALGVAMVVAAVMLVYGGMLYIMGATAQSIGNGKEKIVGALTGLILLFSIVLLLRTINPALTQPASLKVKVVGRNDSFMNPAAEKKRVEEAATVKAPPTEEVPIIVESSVPPAPTSTKTSPTPPSPEAGSSPESQTTPPAPQPGTVAKDNYGNYIAQGDCPSDMRTIKYSADYEAKLKKHVESFCMDTYEAPNQKGALPFEGVTEWEADLYCNAQGKRLCTTSEWSRACLGPQGLNTYGYGPDYKPGKLISAEVPNEGVFKTTNNPPAPCNYDSNAKGSYIGAFQNIQLSMGSSVYIPKTWEENALNPNSTMFSQDKVYKSSIPKLNGTFKQRWDVMMGLFNGYNAKEPSGTRSGCATTEGVYDMNGNVAEIALSDAGGKMKIDQRIAMGVVAGAGKPYRWRGFYWSPIAHLGCTSCKPTCNSEPGTDHALGWRGFENGFRCCMNLKPNE